MTQKPQDVELSTSLQASADLVGRLANDDISRRGPFWGAVRVAHEGGSLGQGRRIAVIDSGFDLSQPLLARAKRNRRTQSRNDDVAKHGTAVAMIIAVVAPMADLLLKDVCSSDLKLDLGEIANALGEALNEADVICLSLGTPAAMPPFSPADLPVAKLFEPGGGRTQLRKTLKEWVENGAYKGHSPQGCSIGNPLCRSVERATGASPLIVAAAGNSAKIVLCPAVHENVLAVGFQSVRTAKIKDAGVVEEADVQSNHSLLADLWLNYVPGFEGTSFAAPLMAGFSALVELGQIWQGVTAYQATEIAATRHMRLLHPPAESAEQSEVYEGLEGLYSLCEELRHPSHSHLRPHPCAYCSLLHQDLWRMRGLLRFSSGNFVQALEILSKGTAIAPYASGLLANLAETLNNLGHSSKLTSESRKLGLAAADLWARAERCAYGFPDYSTSAREALAYVSKRSP